MDRPRFFTRQALAEGAEVELEAEPARHIARTLRMQPGDRLVLFDGSGADNFFDAGSCIDGRLTSAWNWCSKIQSKPYYPIFLLTGFVGFNGPA